MGKIMRLDKLLANYGYGSRKDVRSLVKRGLVKVSGVIVKDSAMHVNPEEETVEIDGEILNYREYVYLMMNKPAGVISATFDNRHRTVIDILPDEYLCFELFPVGRLDIDTEGLLLLTNDGALAHELLSPRHHVPKKYYAVVEGMVDESDVKMFHEGIMLSDGYKTLPAELKIERQGNYSEVEVVIYEGKFHQIKRMFEATGKRVKYLRRIQMGNLKLDDSLKPGECRELTDEEIESLKSLK